MRMNENTIKLNMKIGREVTSADDPGSSYSCFSSVDATI